MTGCEPRRHAEGADPAATAQRLDKVRFDFGVAGSAWLTGDRSVNMCSIDKSNGYESVASVYISTRSNVGDTLLRKWARQLPRGGSVLDLGCGHGVPVSEALINEGFAVFAIDASPCLVSAFRERFPDAISKCVAVEDSDFFNRTFDAVVAIGLVFLLTPASQEILLKRVSQALSPGGRFIFTAPKQACEWRDVLTGRESVSLGADRYRQMLVSEGFTPIMNDEDEGGNHYYLAEKLTNK